MARLKLTQQQQAAVENRGGSLLVSAAAGSGKTKVLVDRLFYYVIEERRNLDDFLIITYTKAAAAELRGKIAAELNRRIGENPTDSQLRRQLLRVYQADIKTVDSFCTGLLRENAHLLAREGDRYTLTPDFRVLDEGETKLIQHRVLERTLDEFYEQLDIDDNHGGRLLADTLGAGRDDSRLSELVLELYNKIQSHANPDQWLLKNREIWNHLDITFDDTPYASELLTSIRRTASHWANRLRSGAAKTEGDDGLYRGYGEKFLAVSFMLDKLYHASCWEEARSTIEHINFPRLTTPRGRKEEPAVLALKQIWEGCKAAIKKLEDWLAVNSEEAMEDLRAVSSAMTALLNLTMLFSEHYRQERLQRNVVDFSDEEHLALGLLISEDGTPTELGEQIAARYQEILVDEYQDTNEIQNAIFRAVSKNGQNIFTVGDVKQSIYRFRLADPTIFLEKYKRFQPYQTAVDGEERKILLSQNFRSRREILDAANFIFANILSPEMGEMTYGSDEALYFGAEYYPERTDCSTEFHLISVQQRSEEYPNPVKKTTAEARFTAKRIRELLDSQYPVTGDDGTLRPCRPDDIVILMRSPGNRSRVFAEALADLEIPCAFQENDGFFDTMEVSIMISMLEIIDNPKQDVPLIAVLRSPLVGFTADRLAWIRAEHPEGDFCSALESAAAQSNDMGLDCQKFLEILEKLRLTARDMSVHRLIWHIYNTWNVLGIFGSMDHGTERKENLIAFSQHAEHFESGGYRGLFAFVTQLRQLLEQGHPPVTAGPQTSDGVHLMSIHKSKGLEFPIVILADLDHAFSKQDFNSSVLVHPTLGLGPKRVELERKIQYPTLARLAIQEKIRRENLAEEQRILYVAMTRPKEKLILVDAMYHAPKRLQKLAAGTGCPVPPETVSTGKSLGDWILLPLFCRPESVPIRALAGIEIQTEPEHAKYINHSCAWEVFCHDSAEFQERPVQVLSDLAPDTETASGSQKDISFDPEFLEFSYPYSRETELPAKLTATQLKGRKLDEEIAENATHTPYIRPLTQPRFRQMRKGLTPAERGTAIHLVMQYLDFHNLDAEEQISQLRENKLLTDEQADALDLTIFTRFLRSRLAREIRGGKNLLREYPFTILLDAHEYDPKAQSESDDKILFQGVVDCCFETDTGLTVVDFKSDHVFSREMTHERAELYRSQLIAYSRALERVLEKPVTRRILYFLNNGMTIEI